MQFVALGQYLCFGHLLHPSSHNVLCTERNRKGYTGYNLTQRPRNFVHSESAKGFVMIRYNGLMASSSLFCLSNHACILVHAWLDRHISASSFLSSPCSIFNMAAGIRNIVILKLGKCLKWDMQQRCLVAATGGATRLHDNVSHMLQTPKFRK